MELDPQAVINEIARQRNEALNRCAVLASENTILTSENSMLKETIKNAEKPKKEKNK